MKNLLLTIAISTVVLPAMVLLTSNVALAHELKENNGISVVLHIPPEDNPKAAQPTELNFTFASTQGNFNLNNCNCQVAVKSNGKNLQTVKIVPALSGATLQGVATVRFPAIGIYDLVVSGNAYDKTFNSFQLDYLERITTSASGATMPAGNGEIIVILSIGSLIIGGMVAYSAISRGGRYRRQSLNIETNKTKRK